MTTADPISLAQAQRLAANADTILLRATRPADLETPIGAFLRLDDGGPAYLLESVEGGERLGRYSFLGVGPRRLLEVRDGVARDPDPAGHRRRPTRPTCRSRRSPAADPLAAHPRVRPAPPRRSRPRGCRGSPAAPSARSPTTRSSAFEPTVPLPERDPVGVPIGRLHRDRPRPRLRPPDPHPVGDRLAPHRGARPRGPLPDRRGGDLRGARADRAAERGRDGRAPRAAGRRGGREPAGAAPPRRRPIETSLGRDEYIHAVEVAKDAIAAGEAIQVVLARRQSFDLPTDPATGAPLDGIGLYRALRRVNPSPYLFFVRTPDVRGRRRLARSCCSRSRATG